MRAGLLNHIIVITRPTVVRDNYGAEETVFERVLCTRANRVYRNSQRTGEDGRVVFDNSITFEVRQHTDVRYNDVIECEGLKYRVLGIIPMKDTRNQKIIVNVEEIHE